MTEIKPDLSDPDRCISVHWALPMQCIMHPSHAAVWHMARHPETDRLLRYRRAMGVYRTEEMRDGTWTALDIPAPPAGALEDARTALREEREDAADARRERDDARDEARQWHNAYQRQATAREWLQGELTAARAQRDEAHADVRQLTEERDRAREIAVALEQQLAEVERLAYEGGQDDATVRCSILGVFEDGRPAGTEADQ